MYVIDKLPQFWYVEFMSLELHMPFYVYSIANTSQIIRLMGLIWKIYANSNLFQYPISETFGYIDDVHI